MKKERRRFDRKRYTKERTNGNGHQEIFDSHIGKWILWTAAFSCGESHVSSTSEPNIESFSGGGGESGGGGATSSWSDSDSSSSSSDVGSCSGDSSGSSSSSSD